MSGTSSAGAAVTLAELERDPHPVLAMLREREPVAWVPVLSAWLVTRRDLALEVMRDAVTYTVDDPRFSTAQVVGPSMLSLDGEEHRRQRDPFARAFRRDAVRERFTAFLEAEVDRLIDGFSQDGETDLRRTLAGPLAVSAMVRALGLENTDPDIALGWYAAIVDDVTAITAGRPASGGGADAFATLRERVGAVLDRDPGGSLVAAAAADATGLTREQVASNAAVLLFGGIDTTEGMIANALLHLLEHPEQRALVEGGPGRVGSAIEESLRLEPAAAVVDRYATCAVELGGARIEAGDLVTVSIAGANRDPAVFADPDQFDLARPNVNRHLAFAQGPHVCPGMHLARLEAGTAVRRTLERLPGLALDLSRPSVVRGLVFRKPATLHVCWRT